MSACHADVEQLNQSVTDCHQRCKLMEQSKRPEADVSHSIKTPPAALWEQKNCSATHGLLCTCPSEQYNILVHLHTSYLNI
jgi:hypothetical protein